MDGVDVERTRLMLRFSRYVMQQLNLPHPELVAVRLSNDFRAVLGQKRDNGGVERRRESFKHFGRARGR